MPRMNGVEATRIIRQEVPESKVILISQNDPTIVSRQAAETGASGYVAKSDLAHHLVAVMNRVVGDRSSENRIRSGVTSESSLSHQCHEPPESVIKTPELKKRPSRSPDYHAESRALAALAQEMANSPCNVLKKLVDIALELGRAHSAGPTPSAISTSFFNTLHAPLAVYCANAASARLSHGMGECVMDAS